MIVIGVPVNKDHTIDVRTAAYCSAEAMRPGVTWSYVSSREAGVGRSTLAYFALKDPKVSHLYFVDSDVVPPPNTLQRLMEHDVPIVAGIYPMLTGRLVWSFKTADDWECVREPLPKGLIKATCVGGSTLLVKREVFEKMERPFFQIIYKPVDENGKCYDYGEDEDFSRKAIALGYEIMVDPSVICDHYNYKNLLALAKG